MRDYHTNIFFSEEDAGYIADITDLRTAQLLARHRNRFLAKFSRPRRLGSRPPGQRASLCPTFFSARYLSGNFGPLLAPRRQRFPVRLTTAGFLQVSVKLN